MAQTFYPTALRVIEQALVDIGAVDPEGGVTPGTSQTSGALEVLNFLVTSWQSHGMQVWCQKTTSLTMVDGTATYTMGPGGDINIARPMSVPQVWMHNTATGYDYVMSPMSRENYLGLANKETEGFPSMFYYDPKYDLPGSNSGASAYGTITLYVTPDAVAAADYTLGIRYTRPIQDFSSSADFLDFPQEWYNALRWNLALNLCSSYEVPLGKWREIARLADETLKLALSNDAPPESMYVAPAQY